MGETKKLEAKNMDAITGYLPPGHGHLLEFSLIERINKALPG